MKLTRLVPLAALAIACGSSKDAGKGLAGSGAANGSGGSNGSGATGGTTVIDVTGGSNGTGTGGSNGTSGTAGTDSTETPQELINSQCAGWKSEPELLPVVLMVVLDNSTSMNDRPPGNGTDSKWVITRGALESALDTMPATASVGLLIFPNEDTVRGQTTPQDITACVNTDAMLPIRTLGDAGSQPRTAISSLLSSTNPPRAGSTPTHDAYDYGYMQGMQASELQGNRFMLLITDGAPTLKQGCQGGGNSTDHEPTQPIIDEILAARREGVRTFIIGAPGSEGVSGVDERSWLSQAAVMGGTAPSGCSLYGPDYCHIDLSQNTDFAGALNAALARILGLITSCTFDVPATGSDGRPVNRDQINVIYTPGGGDPFIVGRDDATDCTDGWQFDAEGRVVLCPNTCRVAQSDSMGQVQLVFGCDSIDQPKVK